VSAQGGRTLGLVLYSGSAASALAVRLAEQAGADHLRLVHFRSPFFLGEEEVAVRAQHLFPGLRFQSVTLKRDFLGLSQRSQGLPFPCGVCRRLLLERVARLVRRVHADLVVTGDIVGRAGLGVGDLVELDRSAGLAGRVLRPLSGRLLPPTRWEEEGKLDRGVLLDWVDGEQLAGRMDELAREQGIDPRRSARDCLLTDDGFVKRLLEFGPAEGCTENTIQLLRFRHSYRLGPEAHVVVAVTAEEQARLQPLFLPSDVRLYVQMAHSPLALVRARWHAHDPDERAWIVAAAAERMVEAAGLPQATAWVVRFRCEWEGETRQMRLPVERRPVPALISS